MLLEAFYVSEGSHHYGPTMSFESWSEICGFIHRHSHRIVVDINGGLQEKIDQATNAKGLQEVISPAGYETLIKIYTDIFLMEAADFQKTSQFPLSSPRVRNLQYKPVFCFVYFMITYFMIKKRLTEFTHSGSQHSLHASINITVGGDIPNCSSAAVVVADIPSRNLSTHHPRSSIGAKSHQSTRQQKTPEQQQSHTQSSPIMDKPAQTHVSFNGSLKSKRSDKKNKKERRCKNVAKSFDCSNNSSACKQLPQLLMASQVLDDKEEE